MMKSIIDNFLKIYNDLNLYGLLIIILLIILLGVIFKNRNTKSSKKLKKNRENLELTVAESSLDNIDAIAKKIEEEFDNDVINLTNFEEDQEESSIISYDELVNKNKPITKNNTIKEVTDVEEQKTSKFLTTPIISPIFGYTEEASKKEVAREYIKQINNKDEDHLEQIPNEPVKPIDNNISNEIKKNEEFLNALKKLKNNLN